MTLQELRAKRKELGETIQRLRKEFDERHKSGKTGEELWPADSREAWDSFNKDYDEVCRKIEALEASEEVNRRAREIEEELRQRPDEGEGRGDGAGGERQMSRAEAQALSMRAWALTQRGEEPSDRELEACELTGCNPRARDFVEQFAGTAARRQLAREFLSGRALSTGVGSEGAFTIPEGFVRQLEIALLQFGPMLQIADVMDTDAGNDMPWPTVNDTDNEGEEINENTAAGEEDVVFGAITLEAFLSTTKMVRVPVSLIEDSAFNMASTLGALLGERAGRHINRRTTTGTGTGQAHGVVTAAPVGVTAAAVAAITADEIIDLLHSVDPAYRDGPNVRFMMNDAVMAIVRKLKDGDGNYLWRLHPENFAAGTPETILGKPVAINSAMVDELAANAKPIVFGDFSKYKIRRVRNIRLRRLVERYAEFDQEAFLGFYRFDGRLLDAGTGPLKVMQMAAS